MTLYSRTFFFVCVCVCVCVCACVCVFKGCSFSFIVCSEQKSYPISKSKRRNLSHNHKNIRLLFGDGCGWVMVLGTFQYQGVLLKG